MEPYNETVKKDEKLVARKATADDIERLIRLRLQYLAEHFGDISDTKQQIVGQLNVYFKAHLGRDFIAFLAEDSGLPVACAFLVVQEKSANPRFPGGRTGLLLNVYTLADYRRMGAASLLLSAVIEEGGRLALSYIELSATEAGEPLYRKFGFEKKDSSHEMMLVINRLAVL